ncbi:hypothetical protein [Streptomyces cinereoruber]|uniref:hypothetical protein n=1 Tax=Streptomyces cinereoruber TaxID=67260 RepID=UPI003656AF64
MSLLLHAPAPKGSDLAPRATPSALPVQPVTGGGGAPWNTAAALRPSTTRAGAVLRAEA